MRSSGGAPHIVHGPEDAFGDAEDAGGRLEPRDRAGSRRRLRGRLQPLHEEVPTEGRLSQGVQSLLLSLQQI